MRLLLDACVDGHVAPLLRAAGHDISEVRHWNPAAADEDILSHAFETRRVLLTLDNDFGRLIIAEGHVHCGVLRIAGFTSSEEPEACLAAVQRYAAELERGALVVFEPDKSRVRE